MEIERKLSLGINFMSNDENKEVKFYKGSNNILKGKDSKVETITEAFSEALGVKNLSFLFGSGCSSHQIENGYDLCLMANLPESGIPDRGKLYIAVESGSLQYKLIGDDNQVIESEISSSGSEINRFIMPKDLNIHDENFKKWVLNITSKRDHIQYDESGIPTMRALTTQYIKKLNAPIQEALTEINLDINQYSKNLEELTNVLFSAKNYFNNSGNADKADKTERVIQNIQQFVVEQCHKKEFLVESNATANIYRSFYRKLFYRDKNLPRPWIFTTNYDLFNEIALDSLSIPYANGFSGFVDRSFNPATFRYTLSQELGISNKKWTTVDAYVYLCKLHGSVNWIEKEGGLFPIKEVQRPVSEDATRQRTMIYPTPAKGNASFGVPYSDLFREFQSKLLQEQGVLFCLGYSFSDEHVNNIIYRALTIPTFRLILLIDPDSPIGKKLRGLNDPRIWVIGGKLHTEGKVSNAHYFESFVKELSPNYQDNRVKDATEKIVKTLLSKNEAHHEGNKSHG